MAVHDGPCGIPAERVEVGGWGEELLSAETAPAEKAGEEGGEGVEAEGEVADTDAPFRRPSSLSRRTRHGVVIAVAELLACRFIDVW